MIGGPNALAGGRLSVISTTDSSACQNTDEPLWDNNIDVPPGLLLVAVTVTPW
jgi:hypothetical protein